MAFRYATMLATHAPISTSASSTLTTARIPRNRLVVPNSLDICVTSERELLTTRRPAFTQRAVQHFPAFIRGSGRLLDRVPEGHELARKVLQRGLELPTYLPPLFCEEQVAHDATDDSAGDRGRHCARVLHGSSSLAHTPTDPATSRVFWCKSRAA